MLLSPVGADRGRYSSVLAQATSASCRWALTLSSSHSLHPLFSLRPFAARLFCSALLLALALLLVTRLGGIRSGLASADQEAGAWLCVSSRGNHSRWLVWNSPGVSCPFRRGFRSALRPGKQFFSEVVKRSLLIDGKLETHTGILSFVQKSALVQASSAVPGNLHRISGSRQDSRAVLAEPGRPAGPRRPATRAGLGSA